MKRIEMFGDGFFDALGPELVLCIGLVLLIVIPNLGDAKFRIPLTSIKIPWLLGGKRFRISGNPLLPALISSSTLLAAILLALMSQNENAQNWMISSEGTDLLKVDGFSRLFEMIFFAALLLASLASMDRFRPTDAVRELNLQELYQNRRQVDLHILLITCALGMSLMALAQNMFLLFIGLEIASFSIYILVAFLKESKAGSEAGVKYFIVGSLASAVGLYGLSLLYLWSGTLQMDGLAEKWASDDIGALPLIGLGLLFVGFGFKVSAVPFHFAAPDAYAGASSPVAGILATASKAMGFLALIRSFVIIALPESGEGSAVWLVGMGVIAAVTMTWGNVAALGSKNPKRMLAYSSVAHAGYMLAGLTAIGAFSWGHIAAPEGAVDAILTAILFHLVVLVMFKMGAFLVLTIVEMEGGGSRLSSLSGLGKREPLLAAAMFIFMLSLAGVPPLAGFLSKLLMILGIVKMAAGDSAIEIISGDVVGIGSLHWIWWLALLVFINSAISLFYYLRIGVVMFFEEPEGKRNTRLPKGSAIRFAVLICLFGTLFFGISGDHLIQLCDSAVQNLDI